MTTEYRRERIKTLVALMFVVGSIAFLAEIIYSITIGQPTPEKRLADYLPPNSRVVRKLSDKWFEVEIEGKPYYAHPHEIHYWFFTPKDK